MTISIRNPVFSRADQSSIDVDYEHPDYGWIPFTARQDDVEQIGRDIYAQAFPAASPYVAPPAPPYQIAKTTPWLRMTDEEAELITGAMQQANARQKAIYDAASYISSDDPLWPVLHDMIASTLGSSSRADELLAPET